VDLLVQVKLELVVLEFWMDITHINLVLLMVVVEDEVEVEVEVEDEVVLLHVNWKI